MAELIVKEIKTPKVEWNYEEIKAFIVQKAEEFTGLVYTDDTIGDAKKDRAELNKLKKALNDRRISLEREYMAPFKEFKGQVDECIKIIENPIGMIDAEVKDYEGRKKAEKREEVLKIFADVWDNEIPYEAIEDEKWYNASTSLASVKEEIEQKNEGIKYDLETIKTLKYPVVAKQEYLKTLDLRKAFEKSNEYDKYISMMQAPKEEPKPEPKKDEPTFTVTFECTLTKSQAKDLRAFFEQNGIAFRKVDL